MEGVAVDEKPMVSNASLKGSVDFLLKEEGVAVDVKIRHAVSPASLLPCVVAKRTIESVGIKDNFNIKGHQVERKKLLLWHQQAEDARVDRTHKFHCGRLALNGLDP